MIGERAVYQPGVLGTLERRAETRWPAGEGAIVTVLASEARVDAEVIDISAAGLRIRVAEPLKLSDGVRVEFRDLDLYGEVRWCRQLHGTGHDVGVEVKVKLTRALPDSAG